MPQTKRIALLISTTGASERNVLKGIGEYARGMRDWMCQFQQPTVENIQRVSAYGPDGVIAAVWDSRWVAPLRSLSVPVVNVSDVLRKQPFPSIQHDSRAIAKMAVRYFVDRGFESLGFVGLRGPHFSDTRGKAFTSEARRLKRRCTSVQIIDSSDDPTHGWRQQDEVLKRWLTSLERPTGILASNDGRAVQLIEAAKEIGLRIPEDIAILGIDNDDLLCGLCRPPLSSIQLSSEKIGFEAARMLDALMAGHTPVRVQRFAPVGIITRQSSDVLAISDPDLSCAIKYIRDNAHRPIRADEVSDQVAIARRSLERRFIAQLGHTILDEIHAAHTDLAKQLLANTDMSIPDVAERSGFASMRHLPLIFKRLTQLTPSQYRAQHRLRE